MNRIKQEFMRVLVVAFVGMTGACMVEGELGELDEDRETDLTVIGSRSANLLRDPTFSRGLHYANGTHREAGLGNACNAMLSRNGVTEAAWSFTDVCEDGCFCDFRNPKRNEEMTQYGSPTKSITIDHRCGWRKPVRIEIT